MTTLEELRQMKQNGSSDEEIIAALQNRGYSASEINNALAQTRIKQAVVGNTGFGGQNAANQPENQELEPSLLASSQQEEPLQAQTPEQNQTPQVYQPYNEYPEYQQYQYKNDYSYGITADTISEIAEQAVSDKLSGFRDKFEDLLNLKVILESKIDYLDERLKRIEKIIDRLQLSVLQKVGEYVTNVEDIKNELIETQQSFKSLLVKSKQPVA